MSNRIIRSHRVRVKQANRYMSLRISMIDREALVEFYLLEDIVRLYAIRVRNERTYILRGQGNEAKHKSNIAKFSAIIDVFNVAAGAARAAIDSGDYKKVWKAVHEKPLINAASNVKKLPELRKLAIELVRELSSDTITAQHESLRTDDTDNPNAHEDNVRTVKGLPPTMDEIEEVIRAAEEAIPDRKRNSRLEPNN